MSRDTDRPTLPAIALPGVVVLPSMALTLPVSDAAGAAAVDEAAHAVHIHVPAGATPKDGPSAGLAMVTALVSLLSGRPVRPDVAMTGEITLQGQVLPVSGLRQKLLAAQRVGLRVVILPARNAAELGEIPEEVRTALEVRFVRTIEEALTVALQPGPAPVG